MNGNDMHFKSPIVIENSHLILEDQSTLPESDKIITNENNFFIIWSGIFNEFTKGNFLEIYANNSFGTGIKIFYQTTVGVDNKIIIKIGREIIRYRVGIIHKWTQYALVKHNNRINLYIDGYIIKGDNYPNINYSLEINNKKLFLIKMVFLKVKLIFL